MPWGIFYIFRDWVTVQEFSIMLQDEVVTRRSILLKHHENLWWRQMTSWNCVSIHTFEWCSQRFLDIDEKAVKLRRFAQRPLSNNRAHGRDLCEWLHPIWQVIQTEPEYRQSEDEILNGTKTGRQRMDSIEHHYNHSTNGRPDYTNRFNLYQVH